LAAEHPLTFNGATCAPSRFTGAKRACGTDMHVGREGVSPDCYPE
jgi:hypothetical protein